MLEIIIDWNQISVLIHHLCGTGLITYMSIKKGVGLDKLLKSCMSLKFHDPLNYFYIILRSNQGTFKEVGLLHPVASLTL